MKTIEARRPDRAERLLSAALLAILVFIGAGVFLRQFQFNPAVVALRPVDRQDGEPAGSPPLLIDTAGSGIVPLSPPEQFGPETLYEKINGRADLYLESGFVSLSTQRFSASKDAKGWVELFVYDMNSPENAFSVFSMQRRSGDNVVNSSPRAYATQNATFLVHGNFYLELIGADASEEGRQLRQRLSQAFKSAQGDKSAAASPGSALFPPEGLLPDSLQLIAANAFGLEFLDSVYTAGYGTADRPTTAFVSVRQTPEEAAALVETYQKALVSYGAAVEEPDSAIDGAVVIRFFDTYEILFSRGRMLAGIHEAKTLETALGLAQTLSDHLERSDEQ